jgi:thiamine kinase-like enzyme
MVKITRYIPHARYPDVFDETDIGRCMALLRRIHGLPARAATTFDLRAVFTEAAAKIDFDAGAYLNGYDRIAAEATSLFETLPVGREQSYCHLDPIKYNFLFSDRPGNRDRMIDFEYAGLSDPFLDLATFAVYNGYKPDLSHTMFSLYLGRSPKAEERRALNVFIALEGLYSAIWYLERLVHGAAVSPDKERAFMRASYSSACAHIGLG